MYSTPSPRKHPIPSSAPPTPASMTSSTISTPIVGLQSKPWSSASPQVALTEKFISNSRALKKRPPPPPPIEHNYQIAPLPPRPPSGYNYYSAPHLPPPVATREYGRYSPAPPSPSSYPSPYSYTGYSGSYTRAGYYYAPSYYSTPPAPAMVPLPLRPYYDRTPTAGYSGTSAPAEYSSYYEQITRGSKGGLGTGLTVGAMAGALGEGGDGGEVRGGKGCRAVVVQSGC